MEVTIQRERISVASLVDARAETVRTRDGGLGLRLVLDPAAVVVIAPSGPDGGREMAEFLRLLALESRLLSLVLDAPTGSEGHGKDADRSPEKGGGLAP
ncbi:hypothetical protein BJF78_29225 [Pseudonocardia sp. CNS-139]|nr:hypothetical protein BJF78_29225 [Pseudonocardia sp. CNS-139]